MPRRYRGYHRFPRPRALAGGIRSGRTRARRPARPRRPPPDPPWNWQILLGYLNFSEGKPDPRFQGQLHAAFLLAERSPSAGVPVTARLAELLDEQLTALHASGAAAFREVGQARAVVQA